MIASLWDSPSVRESGLVLPGEYPAPWPAITGGKWNVPGPVYALDRLIREQIADDAAFQVDSIAAATPDPFLMALVQALPQCDLCSLNERRGSEARYDGPVKPAGESPWAFMCQDCFLVHSPRQLGPGLGQYLMLYDEVPSDIREAFVRARAFWAERGVTIPDHNPFD